MTRKPLFLILAIFAALASMAQQKENVQQIDSSNSREPSAGVITAYNEGVRLANKREYNKAILLYEQALLIDPDYVNALSALGNCFYNIASYDSAAYYLQISLRKDPQGISALTSMCLVEQKRRRLPESLKYARQIVSLEPDNPEGYYNVSTVLLTMARFKEAASQAQQAEKLYIETNDPQLGDCYLLELVIYFNMGNKAMCRKYRALCTEEGVTFPAGLAIDPR